jgi:hypothetical protein
VYSQITLTQAAKGNQQLGTLAASGFSPIACNSSANTTTTTAGVTTSAGCNNALPGTAGAQNVPTNANGYNVGIIHTF